MLLQRIARGRHHAEGGRHRHARAVAVAVEAGSTSARRTPPPRAAAPPRARTRSARRSRPWRGAPSLLAQALAQRSQQRVVRRLRQVVHLDALRQLLAAGRADGDEGSARCAAPRPPAPPWRAPGRRRRSRHPPRRGSSAGQLSASTNASTQRTLAAGWMSAMRSRQRLDLGHAERRAQRLHLAVDVRLGDVVEVDQHSAATPQRASASAAHEPTPPRPTTATRAARRRA